MTTTTTSSAAAAANGPEDSVVFPFMEEFADDPAILSNFRIQATTFLPFCCLILSFLVVLCRRKIEDFYLRQSMLFLVASMALRTLMCMVIIIAVIAADENDVSFPLLNFKLQVVQFSLPYYCFLMISVTLIVSSMQFYVNLRALLYPEIEA